MSRPTCIREICGYIDDSGLGDPDTDIAGSTEFKNLPGDGSIQLY
ncbi:MAG: rubredoxin [Lentisphaeria bacterium]|jgi:rubredoxin|nr:rubredoxin [Lentisphaeria bacterium]MDP7743296.1 rubredoxin [Lentisphaeria bacterium]